MLCCVIARSRWTEMVPMYCASLVATRARVGATQHSRALHSATTKGCICYGVAVLCCVGISNEIPSIPVAQKAYTVLEPSQLEDQINDTAERLKQVIGVTQEDAKHVLLKYKWYGMGICLRAEWLQ